MKKIVTLILVLLLVLVGCEGLVNDIPDGSITEGGGIDNPNPPQNPSDSPNNPTTDSTHTHTYTKTVTLPTCEAKGYTTYSCQSCDYFYLADETPATHNEETISGKEATCKENGLTDGKQCTICKTFTVPQKNIPAVNHDYKGAVTAPTCEKKGYTTYTCSKCNDSCIAEITPVSAHTEVTIPGKNATHTEAGLTDGKQCTVCKTVTVAQVTIPPLGHNYVAETTAPTCEKDGFTTFKCSECGDSFTADKISAKGHTEITVTGKAATCTANGLTDGKKCSTCGTVTVVQVTITATGHNWAEATTEAPKTCKTCGSTEGEKLPSTPSGYNQTLYVNYINVGQGDSILIKVGDCDILIDAGPVASGSTVVNYLNSKGVDDIELMINTHPDADHCGGLTSVLNSFAVEQVWASSYTSTSQAYKNFKSAVSSEGLSMKTPTVGTIYTYEYLTITVLYAGAGASNSNDSSIVVMVQYGSLRFLFTGDISSTIEDKLVSNSNIDLSCDVLKVAHHGSKYSSSSSFLKAASAKYGVICVGTNSYGHPTQSALNNLSSAGTTVYRTDKNGNVVFSTNGITLTIPGGSTVNSSSGSSSASSSNGTSSSSITFIGNNESKVFHLPTCTNLPAVSKRNYLYNYWFIVNCIGYRPCQICLKDYEP